MISAQIARVLFCPWNCDYCSTATRSSHWMYDWYSRFACIIWVWFPFFFWGVLGLPFVHFELCQTWGGVVGLVRVGGGCDDFFCTSTHGWWGRFCFPASFPYLHPGQRMRTCFNRMVLQHYIFGRPLPLASFLHRFCMPTQHLISWGPLSWFVFLFGSYIIWFLVPAQNNPQHQKKWLGHRTGKSNESVPPIVTSTTYCLLFRLVLPLPFFDY